MPRKRLPLMVAAVLTVGGCADQPIHLPRGAAAYDVIPVANENAPRRAYRIGPLDVLSVNVFQEPELTLQTVQVDASGNMLFPLIGEVRAQGRTSAELSREIALRLGSKYIVNPQVTVAVTSSVSQRVTVEGSVNDPGVYEITGGATLLEALARAKSTTPTARTNQIVVFRTIDGKRAGAVFDVEQIRAGNADDPEVRGGDVIVVGYSALKGAYRDFLAAAPILNLFRAY